VFYELETVLIGRKFRGRSLALCPSEYLHQFELLNEPFSSTINRCGIFVTYLPAVDSGCVLMANVIQ